MLYSPLSCLTSDPSADPIHVISETDLELDLFPPLLPLPPYLLLALQIGFLSILSLLYSVLSTDSEEFL